ncbi:hypothetical protein Q604_UNBC02245G0001, partial [human gut metagenome]
HAVLESTKPSTDPRTKGEGTDPVVSPLPLCYGSSTQRPALAGTLAGAVGPAAVLTATSRTTAITALRPHSSRNASRPSRGTAHRRSLPVKAWLAWIFSVKLF